MTWSIAPRQKRDPAEEAAGWLLRLERGKLSSTQQSLFNEWVASDPSHRAALERAAEALEVTSRHAGDLDIMQMREAALRARGKSGWTSWALAGSLVSVGVLLSATWALKHHSATPRQELLTAVPPPTIVHQIHYATAVGERATISLPDGSTATLDTQSELDVTYSNEERGIRLLRGQAYFEVAKHKATPFQVYAGGRRITAMGTTFNVRIDGERVRVALLEGKVRVAAESSALRPGTFADPVILKPGEILDATPAATMNVQVADIVRTTSWREGVSVFVDARLADVVAEMNRYTTLPIKIADSATGELRISGVFKAGDPERFASSVADVFPIVIDHGLDGSVVLRDARRQQ
jgi:transmembrane sensor